MRMNSNHRQQDDDACDQRCPGNDQESCGGSQTLSIWGREKGDEDLFVDVLPAPPGTMYLGCFENERESPLMPGDREEDQDMTIEACETKCFEQWQNQYMFFGLSNANQCGKAQK